MITEAEVIGLYRTLLGRDPEGAATISAFQSYYPSYERGRRAIFTSDEFAAFFAEATGRTVQAREDPAGSLALALLARAAAVAPAPPPAAMADDGLRAGMEQFFAQPVFPRFAVAVGDPGDLRLDDLAPLGQTEAALLHVAPGFPPVLPLTGALADGTTLFRIGGDPGSIAQFLAQYGRRIDALYLLGRPAGLDWVQALRPHFAPRMLLALGRQTPGFDAARLSETVAASLPGEPVQVWRGLHLHHLGGWLLPVTYAPPQAAPAAPDKAAYPSLAIAAIVRDEALCVGNMLASALPVASFVAVLDTGSQDDTVARVRSILKKSRVNFALAQRDHAAFGDDFSAMRNAALAMVPDGMQWVLMLDADEELVPEDHEKLLRLIGSGTHEAYALPRYNFPGADKAGQVMLYPDRQTRLLRRTPDGRIRYSGAVHETVRGVTAGCPPLDAACMGGERGGPHIHHLVRRFRTPEAEARKQAFYQQIAQRAAADSAAG